MGKPGGIRFRSMSKYKQIVKVIYPVDLDGEMQVQNISKLVHFCEITPQKILKVSKYIERKAGKDLARGRINFVGFAMKIYQELIFKCRKHLNLFASNVLNLIRTSLEGNHAELKIIATETFIQFAKVLDESSQYPELESLVTHFITMSQCDQGELPVIIRIREEGLRAIRAYMGVLAMTDELDSFITRFTDADNRPRFVPVILENVTYRMNPLSPPARANNNSNNNNTTNNKRHSISSNNNNSNSSALSNNNSSSSNANNRSNNNIFAQGNVEENSLQSLASDVLRDVFTCANISVTSLFRAILSFLDVRNRWVTNNFAIVCFSAIYNCLKPQHEQILMTLFLQHLEQNRPANVKKQIMLIMVEFFRETTGHFSQILDSLTRHLVSSVEVVSQDVRARDYEDHLELQVTAINCVGVICKKSSSRNQKIDAFNVVCEKVCSSKHFKPTGLAGAVLALAQCILKIVNEIKGYEGFDPEYMAPSSINLLRELAIHAHNEIRITAHKICQSMLLAGQPIESRINSRRSVNITLEEKLIAVMGEIARDSVLEQIKFKNNQPENFSSLFHTLNILLQLGQKKEFYQGFPMIFAMQKSASKWKKIASIYAHTINTIIAAYLYAGAVMFDCPPLTAYVDEIVEKRKQLGHVCTCVVISKQPFVNAVLFKDKYAEDPKRKVAIDYVLFDKDHIVELLINTPSCLLRSEARLKRILGKKIHRNTRTLRMSTMDMQTAKLLQDDENFTNSATAGTPLPPNSSLFNYLTTSSLNVFANKETEGTDLSSPATVPSSSTDVASSTDATSSTVNSPEVNQSSPGVNFSSLVEQKEKVVFMPGCADEAQQAQLTRIRFHDMKDAQDVVVEQPKRFSVELLFGKPFAAVSTSCFEAGVRSQERLSAFSKIRKFKLESFDFSFLPTHHPTASEDKLEKHAEFTKIDDNYVDNSKTAYVPPTCTLSMDFNIDEFFYVM